MALDFLAGCIGGCAGIIASHPFDTLKVQIQSGNVTSLKCTRDLLKNGSLSRVYRGMGAPLGGVAAVNAIVFGAYGNTKRALPNQDSIITQALAGGSAGMLQSFACAPVELVKTRQQIAKTGDMIPRGAWSGVRYVIQTGGFKALFRGVGITMARDCPGFAIYFSLYEVMTRGEKSVMRVFTAGGVAGALSWVLLYPIDVVKSRLQGDAIGRYTNAWDCFIKSIQLDGWRCMRRGIGAVTLRAFISNGACFTAVVWTERAWQRATLSTTTIIPLAQSGGIYEAVRYETPEYNYDR